MPMIPDKAIRVLMVGPQPTVQGGITTVVANFRAHWNVTEFPIRHLPSFADGTKLFKLLVAMWALLNGRPAEFIRLAQGS